MPRDLLLVAFSLFVWGIGEGMFMYFQPIYLQQFGANPFQIGAILSAMGIGMAVVQIPAGHLADRVGARPIMWASWVTGTVAGAIMAAAQTLNMFIVGLILFGLTSFVLAPMNSYATSVRGNWSVARALTLISALFNLGAVAGPIVGGLLGDRYGLRFVYALATGIFVLSTAIILFARKPPQEEHHPAAAQSRQQTRALLMPFIGLVFLTMLATYLPQPLTSNFLKNQAGLTLGQIGWLGSAGNLGNAVIMLGLGWMSPISGLLLGQALMGVFALLMWRGSGMVGYAFGYFFLGGYRLCRSMVLAFIRPLIQSNRTGLVYGLVESANGAAIIVAPLLAGALYTANPISMYTVGLIANGIVFLINLTVMPILKQSAMQVDIQNLVSTPTPE